MITQDFFKHSYKFHNRESLSLAIYNTGHEQCQGLHRWGPAVRDHFLIHAVVSGKGKYWVGEQCYQLSAGDMFLVYPGGVITYQADPEEPWEYFWAGFNGIEAERLLRLSPFSEEEPVFRPADIAEPAALLQQIIDERGNDPANEAGMTGRLYLFLSWLMQQRGQTREPRQSRDYISTAVRFIQCNYSNRIDVSDVADYTGVSRSHLYRLFVKYVGMPPNTYIARYRINEACALLREGRLSISEIASSVGFEDRLYFSRVFKKLKGVPPTEFCHLQEG